MRILTIEEFETGRNANGRFTEGHIPWLKGTKDLVRPNCGYDCLIIWDDELRKGKEEAINTKIGEFLED